MIKLKLNVKNGKQIELQINKDELLSTAIDRALDGVPIGDSKKEEVFQVLVNGLKIDHEMWGFVKLNENDKVLIAPNIRGGDDSPIRQLLVVAATVAASYFLGPAGYGLTGISLSLATAAVTIGVGLLLGGMIPPPNLDGLGDSSNISGSQMYSITSQSNANRKFNTVPKIYGRHKIFPVVAANPYTELEVDPNTKELVQYFYAIYDFGFGPMKLDNIQIGDTPITDYSDFNYNLYDTGKPVVDEGDWDKETTSSLKYYKGDVSNEGVSVVLDGNKNAGGPQDTWEAIRNSAENIDGSNQSILLTFVNPSGLFSFASNGDSAPRTIILEIFFALVGTDEWFGFNDLDYVDDFTGIGGDQAYTDSAIELFPPEFGNTDVYPVIYQSNSDQNPNLKIWNVGNYSDINTPYVVRIRDYGFEVGSTSFVVKDNSSLLVVGKDFRYRGQTLGKIASVSEYGPDNAYSVVVIDKPLKNRIKIASYEYGEDKNAVPVVRSKIVEDNSNGFSILNRIIGRAVISRNETNAAYSSFKFTPRNPGQYKVKVTRISTSSQYSSQVQDSLTWGQISTRFDRSPIQTDKRHLFMELKIRATNQLNGAISNLSAVANSALDVYDSNTQTWSKQLTNNPAWVFVDLLSGEVNKRPIDKSRIDVDSILEWADFCEEVPTPPPGYDYTYPRFECNFILDYQTTLLGVLNQVSWAAQASLNIVDGKYGVLIDKLKTIPVQVFTPRNSRDFSSSRSMARKPDGLTIKYIDPTLAWQVTETSVYDNGFDETNAIDMDELTSFACTNQEQAWRFGRYMMAQNRLRQETITLVTDFEHLICTRGDYVQISQDVMKVGGFPARVKSISGNQITIDDSLELNFGPTYGFVFRSPSLDIVTNTLTVINSDTFDLDGPDLPEVGDLIIIGVVGQIVFDCIVKSIAPNDDLTATITLIEKADAIFDAESTDVFPDYDPQISQTADQNITAPSEVEDLEITDNTWECDGLGYRYFINLDWDVPLSSAFEFFQVFADYGKGYTEVGTTRDTEFSYTVNEEKLGTEHKFKVIAVSATGRKLDLGAVGFVSATPLVKSERPSDVETLAIDITDQVLQLTWKRVTDCDVQEYLIRYSTVVEGASWEASIPCARVNRENSTAAVQARTGTYLIKAIDFAGNESTNAAYAITTIPSLFDLNVIEEINDFPDLLGTKDTTIAQSGALLLKESVSGAPSLVEYYPEGYYYYESFLDLGEIFTVRLQSLIQAEGITAEDVMANWLNLSSVAALSNTLHSDWDVESQYRATNNLNVMEEWLALSDIDLIGGGSDDDFTEWRPFIMGDATGRRFQFRLKLQSNKVSVTPRVFDGIIKADMPDRREQYNNLTSSGGYYDVVYSTPFKGPGTSPVVTVSVDDLDGARVILSMKTLAGVRVSFVDENNDPVDRTFDIAVAGYGRQALSVI